MPNQQAGKAGGALTLEPQHSPSGWALGDWLGLLSAPSCNCCAQSSQPRAMSAQDPPPQSSSEQLQDNPQHFLKCWTSELPEMLTLHLLSMLRRRREEFKSNQPIWLHCSKCLYLSFPTQKPTSPTPQASTEDPATLSRFKFVKWLLLSPVFREERNISAFSARNLHSEFSGRGQITSDSCSEMQDLVTCSTIKLPRASRARSWSLYRHHLCYTDSSLSSESCHFTENLQQQYQTYVPTKTAP